jgi:hypothetical protein
MRQFSMLARRRSVAFRSRPTNFFVVLAVIIHHAFFFLKLSNSTTLFGAISAATGGWSCFYSA